MLVMLIKNKIRYKKSKKRLCQEKDIMNPYAIIKIYQFY